MKATEIQELKDFNIQLITIGCLDKSQSLRMSELINEALASLQAEPCKKCGGKPRGIPAKDGGWITCPDCKAEPGRMVSRCVKAVTPEEIKNELHRRHDAGKETGDDHLYLDVLELLDSQQSDLAAKEERIMLLKAELGGLKISQKRY